MNKIKILVVANVAKEHVNKFHIPTIKYLKSKGWQVDVACKLDAEIPEVDKVYPMVWERSPFSLKTFWGINELEKIIVENKYNVIYCHTPVGGLVARFAARRSRKLFGTKVVYCAHGLHFYKGAPIINWLLYYPMEKLMAKFTDMFITINQEDYVLVKSRFNPQLVVEKINGIGVDFHRLDIVDYSKIRVMYREQLGIPHDAHVLIYVAEILKNKNQKMLIRTLKILQNRGRDKCFLLLVGPDHSNGEYKKLVSDLGLNNKVKFLGWRSDIGELMATSDICVASSIREGFGINLIEAQYCHLPVIATDNRGHRSIIEDGVNGYLVPMNDSEAMADKIEMLLTQNELFDKFSNIDVTSYSSKNISEKIYNLLNEELD